MLTSLFSSTLRRSFRQALREASNCGQRRVPFIEQLENRQLLAVVSLSPIADASLYQDAAGADANGIGQHLFAGVTAQNSDALRRALRDIQPSLVCRI